MRKKKPAKPRLRVKRPENSRKKSSFRVIDYIILGVGAVAAVVVAVWGGYYLGSRTDEPAFTAEVRSIIGRANLMVEKGEIDNAEKILLLEMRNRPDNEYLALELARIYIMKKQLVVADDLIHRLVTTMSNRRLALQELREAYREVGDQERVFAIARELAHLDEDDDEGSQDATEKSAPAEN